MEEREMRLILAPRGRGVIDGDAFHPFNAKPLGAQRAESSCLSYPGRMVGLPEQRRGGGVWTREAPGALGNRRWSNERFLRSVGRNDGEMGEEARETPRASQTVAQHFSGNGEPLKVFESGVT